MQKQKEQSAMKILNPNLFLKIFLFYIFKYNSAARKLGSFEFFVAIGCERYQVAVKHFDA